VVTTPEGDGINLGDYHEGGTECVVIVQAEGGGEIASVLLDHINLVAHLWYPGRLYAKRVRHDELRAHLTVFPGRIYARLVRVYRR